ncbi:PEP/pyruvate-binding domain-containing protein [Streptosporangium sandarakinum]|uniref:PEP/pyruvate-binding domain-containing protein n=1 Tax=Streptosporangium sandarakinum TaxID=1260955 RepID=UPI0033B1BA61
MTSLPLIALADATDPALCGGKAAALAQLMAVGLPVPDGVVVPATLPADHVPDVVAPIFAWAAARAPYGLVARSSAPHEDGADASFAGLYASVFTPAEPAALLRALQRVRASAAAVAAAAYASSRSTAHSTAMAILLQPAVRPYASGVLAAERDATGVRWRVEAIRGLAEPLVSGRQTGEIHTGGSHDDRAVIPCDQATIAVPGSAEELCLPPGDWTVLHNASGTPLPAKVHLSEDGIVHLHQPAAWADQPVLTAGHVDALVAAGIAAADALGWDRIDVEWAFIPDGLQLLQARPLTAPLPPPIPASGVIGEGCWRGIPAVPGIGVGAALHLTADTAARSPPTTSPAPSSSATRSALTPCTPCITHPTGSSPPPAARCRTPRSWPASSVSPASPPSSAP